MRRRGEWRAAGTLVRRLPTSNLEHRASRPHPWVSGFPRLSGSAVTLALLVSDGSADSSVIYVGEVNGSPVSPFGRTGKGKQLVPRSFAPAGAKGPVLLVGTWFADRLSPGSCAVSLKKEGERDCNRFAIRNCLECNVCLKVHVPDQEGKSRHICRGGTGTRWARGRSPPTSPTRGRGCSPSARRGSDSAAAISMSLP